MRLNKIIESKPTLNSNELGIQSHFIRSELF